MSHRACQPREFRGDVLGNVLLLVVVLPLTCTRRATWGLISAGRRDQANKTQRHLEHGPLPSRPPPLGKSSAYRQSRGSGDTRRQYLPRCAPDSRCPCISQRGWVWARRVASSSRRADQSAPHDLSPVPRWRRPTAGPLSCCLLQLGSTPFYQHPLALCHVATDGHGVDACAAWRRARAAWRRARAACRTEKLAQSMHSGFPEGRVARVPRIPRAWPRRNNPAT